MANITENNIWESGIYQLETDDPTLGGPPGFNLGEPVTGHANAQAQQLANRTKYLKNRVDVDLANTADQAKGAGMVGYKADVANSVGRTVRNKLKDYISVKDFGAIGDGVTDDTASIQSAINSEKTIYFPPGTYLISSAIILNSSGKTLIGSDRNSVTVKTTTASTMVSISGVECGIYNINFDHATPANGSLRTISGQDAYFLTIENCNFKMTPQSNVFGDTAIHLTASYWTRISFTKINFVPTSTIHSVTGLTTNVCSGTGIYSQNTNAFFVTDVTLIFCGRGIHLHDDDGVTLKGISCEHFYQGIRVTGNSYLNTIEAVRCESHFENFVQLLPPSQEQCGIFFDSTTKQNDVIGPIFSNYALYQPHGMGVIDKGFGNSWKNFSNGDKPVDSYRPLVSNGYLDEWNGSSPEGWEIFGSSTLSREVIDIPQDPNILSALKISSAGNGSGVKSKTIMFNPSRSRQISVKFWAKRLTGTPVFRFGVWNEDVQNWVESDFGLHNDYGLTSFSQWGEWTLYRFVGTIAENKLNSAANISFVFSSKGSGSTDFLVAGINIWQGILSEDGYRTHRANPQLPSRREQYLQAAPTSGSWSKGDRVWNSSPNKGLAVGWVCTTTGSPGVWQEFGQNGVLDSVASTPSFIGQVAVVAGEAYIAVGLTSQTDWKKITN